jgi:nanoRNase/pAp phosphatase (c-di-AMP/oligoRNAs hydrolase)
MPLDRDKAESLLVDIRSDSKFYGQSNDEDRRHFDHGSLYDAIEFLLSQMIQNDDKERTESVPKLHSTDEFLGGG